MSLHEKNAWDTLVLPGQPEADGTPPWAVFDAPWYRARYRDAPDGPDTGLLAWHLAHGQVLGHSPNRLFDEEWQRSDWLGIADVIARGHAVSAFDAWCRGAHVSRAPHWLFDPSEYRRCYAGLTDAALAEAGLANLYDHYLRFGDAEHRIAHRLFDPALYLTGLAPNKAATAPFDHFLRHGAVGTRTSALFDPVWYAHRYPRAARAAADGRYGSLLAHYLCNDSQAAFDPSPWFSEQYYLATYPGLADAIGPEGFRNGFAHFLKHGLPEGRSPHPDLDLTWYSGLAAVRADLEAGRAPDAMTHWILLGEPGGLAGHPPRPIAAGQAAALLQARAAAVWPLFTRRRPDFSLAGVPAVLTVVMAVRDDLAATLVSLASLRAQTPAPLDLILIATDPSGPGLDIEAYATGATILRFASPLPDSGAREAGLVCATAPLVLFLGDGIELAPGAIDAAMDRLTGDRSIGAIGGRLTGPDGRLLDAGGIVWRDGGLEPYLPDASPLAAEANFVRDIAYCQTRFLMARTAVLTGLPPAEDGIAGTAHEAADLCLRIWRAGFRVVHDPAVLGFSSREIEAPGPDGLDAFRRAHATDLAARPVRGAVAAARARSPEQGQCRVLFVEDTVPLRTIGSGFVRSNDIVRAMVAAGALVTVFPLDGYRFPLAAIQAALPDTVEVPHERSLAGFADFLAERRDCFDLIWVSRTHNLDRVRSALNGAVPVLVDTEAVASLRREGRFALAGEAFDRDRVLAAEFRHLNVASRAIAVSEAEAAIVRANGSIPVSVLGHASLARPTPRSFQERAGILFVGAIHDRDSPNYDGLEWFVDAVLPLLERALRWETRLTIAGYAAPGVDLDRFRGHPRITVRGAVTELEPLYAAHRVFVAPTRYAAGLPYKVHEAAAFGVPTVVTSLLAGQLGWSDGVELTAAAVTDPAGFAARVIALYREEALWTRIREAALARVAADLDPADFAARVKALLPGSGGRMSIL